MAKIDNYPHGSHPTEFYAHREAASKAKWHYDRAGKMRGASLSKGIKSDYEAQLLKHGVTDASGHQTPLVSTKTGGTHEPLHSYYRQQGMKHTKLLNVGDDDPEIKTGFAFRE